MKLRRKRNIKTTEKITIYCEGISEKAYIENLLKEKNLHTPNIELIDVKGKGYKNILDNIQKNSRLNNIVFVICDLDRAKSDNAEPRKLQDIIGYLEKENKKNNVFLSNPNFEYFVAACLGKDIEDLKNLKYKKGNAISRFIKENDGSYEMALKCMGDDYYFEKQSFKKGVYRKENIDVDHSNLKYFIDYLNTVLER